MSTAQKTHHHRPGAVVDVITALSMTVGRGRAARVAADLAHVGPNDRVADIGCGPGTAIREATRRGAQATGVDPSPTMLRLARWITALTRVTGPTFIEGTAEALPLPDRSADVVWALSSLHHWTDRTRGFGEALRVLSPGGRLLIAECSVKHGARGYAAHGLTTEDDADLAQTIEATGFLKVERQTRRAGRRTLVLITATSPLPTSTGER
jgi:ubiquinone/menaquinone biosynthesis C-methylase UbiE